MLSWHIRVLKHVTEKRKKKKTKTFQLVKAQQARSDLLCAIIFTKETRLGLYLVLFFFRFPFSFYSSHVVFEDPAYYICIGLCALPIFWIVFFLKVTTGIRNFEISLATFNPSLVMILEKMSNLKVCLITNIIFFNIFYVVWCDLSATFLAEMFGIWLCLWAIHVPGNNKSLWLKSVYTVRWNDCCQRLSTDCIEIQPNHVVSFLGTFIGHIKES